MTDREGGEISFFVVLVTILTLLGPGVRGVVLRIYQELEVGEGRGS